MVAVGASTGGPGALTDLLRSLPAGFRAPVLCVQHIAASEPFAVAFSDWLAGQTGRDVSYARDWTPVDAADRPGRYSPRRTGTCRCATACCGSSTAPPRHSCRPSVDVLFESVAAEYGADRGRCACSPGWAGTAPRGCCGCAPAGAVTFAQDEASCVVYGMPREAALLGAAAHVLPPARIAARLSELQPDREPAMIHRVLIVDDSLTVRMDLHEAFAADGFATVLCATGAEARAAFAEAEFDAAVLDVLLPDADGLDLLTELRGTAGAGTAW